MEELRRRVAHIEAFIFLVAVATMVVFYVIARNSPRELHADRVIAREFVVMTPDGRKVGHFGTTPERPGEVVLILKDDADHIVALNVAHDFSGAIVKSGKDERVMYAVSRSRAK